MIYRAAVAAAVGSFSLVGDAPILLLAAVGSLVAGYVLARLYMVATPYVRDAAGSTVLQFISTFGVWLLSERLTLSPIITVMVYAMTLAQAASGRLGPRLRITSYAVWETAVFVVNVLAFVLMGLQARPIIERLSPEQRWGSLVFGLTVLALVIVVRIVYLAVYRATVTAIKSWHPASRTGWSRGIRAAQLSYPGAGCAASLRWQPHSRCPHSSPGATSSCYARSAWCSARS